MDNRVITLEYRPIKLEHTENTTDVFFADRLKDATKKLDTVKKRRYQYSKLDAEGLLLTHFQIKEEKIFVCIAHLTTEAAPIIDKLDDSATEVDLAALFAAAEEKGGETHKVLGYTFLYAFKNHAVFRTTKIITEKDFENYFDWLFSEAGLKENENEKFLFCLPLSQLKDDSGQKIPVKQITIGDSYLSKPFEEEINSSIKDKILDIVFGVLRKEESLEELGEDLHQRITVKLDISVKGSKATKQEVDKEALLVNLRHLTDDVKVVGQNGLRKYGNEIRCTKQVRIECIGKGHFPKERELLEAMENVLYENIRNG